MDRILCIVDSLNTGGAETFLMKLYRAIDKNQYQMDFVASGKGYYDEEVRSMGGEVYYIPLRTKHPIGVFREIKRIVKIHHYNSVLKLGSTPIVALDLLAAKVGGAKRIAVRSCNAYADEGIVYKMANVILNPIFKAITNIKIAPSDLAAEFTFGKDAVVNNEVHFLHNAIDLNLYKFDVNERNRIRKEFKIEDKIVYGHVGRLTKQKNHAFLLDVFDAIHKRNTDCVLMLVGTGELENDIKTLVKDKDLESSVIFTGVRSDVPSFLSAFDEFIFPSFYEGMPNTIIEAQANGLTCVISESITKQANITGLVRYVSLMESAETWAGICMENVGAHGDTKKTLIEAGYTIESVVQEFVRIMIGEENDKL